MKTIKLRTTTRSLPPDYAGCAAQDAAAPGVRPDQALDQLAKIVAQPRHEFWFDNIPCTEVRLTGLIGHRQVTDAYLAQLARCRAGRLATFDPGLAELHSDVAHLVPTA